MFYVAVEKTVPTRNRRKRLADVKESRLMSRPADVKESRLTSRPADVKESSK
jgi:hypothetical protein